MWDRITSGDVELAKAALNEKRAEMLNRHADEIKDLDAQLHDIESFERLIEAFFEEYLVSDAAAQQAAASVGTEAESAIYISALQVQSA